MRLFALVLVLCLAPIVGACVAGPDGQPMPVSVSQTTHIKGEVTVGSVMVGMYPMTFPIRAWGEGDLRIQSVPPYVSFLGEGGWIVEPIAPQYEATVRQQVASGALRIPGGHVSPVGTIANRRTK